MNKKHFCVLLFAAVWVCSPLQALEFTTFEFPPFSQKTSTGKSTGPFKTIISDICDEMGEECQFSMLPTRRAKLKVSHGQADAIFPFGWYRERAEKFYFSVPFMLTEYGFFVPSTNNDLVQGLRDIQDFNVGVFGPSNTSKSLESIRNLMISMGLKPIRIKIQTDENGNLIRMLESSRIDAYYSNKAVAEYRAKQFKVTDVRYAWRDRELLYFVAFPKATTKISFVRKFNQAALKLFSEVNYLQSKLAPWGILVPPLSEEVLEKYQIIH